MSDYTPQINGSQSGKTIVWIPCGGRGEPSSRLRVYEVADALERRYAVKNVFPPFQISSYPHAVVAQKICDRRLFPTLKQMKQNHCRCLYDICDPIWMQEEVNKQRNWDVNEMVALADEIIAPTTSMEKALKARYPSCRCRVIADSINTAAMEFQAPKKHVKKETLVVGWIGTALNMEHLSMVAEPLKQLNKLHPLKFRLITASHNGMIRALPEVPVEFIPWTIENHLQHLAECDIMVIPMPITDWTVTKSPNRLQLCWALGIPAVFSPIPSYIELAAGHERLARIARNHEEWVNHLTTLLQPEERNSIGAEAHSLIIKEHSLKARLPLWSDAILCSEACSAAHAAAEDRSGVT